jgi:urease accessory protein
MIARAAAVIDAGGVVRHLTGRPPLSLRQVRSDDPSCAALCLVGSAAGPLAGDQLTLDLELLGNAQARLTATGAMLAQGRAGQPSQLRTRVVVGEQSRLDADPGPLIACAGSRVDVRLDIELAASASLIWREVLVLGRIDEPAGAVRLYWDVVRGGRPLLRQSIDLSDVSTPNWAGLLAGMRVMATELRVGPGVEACTVVGSATAVVQRIADNATLTTVLADNAADASRVLARLASAEKLAS